MKYEWTFMEMGWKRWWNWRLFSLSVFHSNDGRRNGNFMLWVGPFSFMRVSKVIIHG